jgi:hypothetical protein
MIFTMIEAAKYAWGGNQVLPIIIERQILTDGVDFYR